MDWKEALHDPATNERLREIDKSLAIQILTGTSYYMNEAMRARGQAYIERYLAEAKSKGFGPPKM
jgi:hypothetical protein